MDANLNNNVLVELHVPDFAPVKEFYGKLGFEIASEDPTGEYPGYLILKREDAAGPTLIAFYGNDERVYDQSYFKKFPRTTQRGYGVEVVIPVSNIQAVFDAVSVACSEFVEAPLKEKSDGVHVWRDFRLHDPFGFYIRFVSGLPWGELTKGEE